MSQHPEDINVVREIWQFLRVRKKFWLAPIILALLLLGLLISIVGGGSPLSIFLYPL